jgi:hypothetical protein
MRVVTRHFENPKPVAASLDAASNLKLEREDWTSFRTIDGLQQKAGVSKDKLPRLVLKELADNSLDAGGKISLGELPTEGGYYVEDDGPGIDGTPEDIARLFSIRRPMVSSKYFRRPQRGMLGNGLRVVAGAVLASEGSLAIVTRNRRIVLRPERDGSATVVKVDEAKFPRGTRIEIKFGPALPGDENAVHWAMMARIFARSGTCYSGGSSPWWYDAPSFHELLDSGGERPVRELIARLDGCTGGKAGEIVAAAGLSRAICKDITSEQAASLLKVAKEYAKPVTPQRLGAVGADLFSDHAYACVRGELSDIPFVVEAWAKSADKTRLLVLVNRTPVTGNIRAARDNRDIDFFGCELHHNITQAPKEAQFQIWLNITTPYMSITSDGKEPDLEPFLSEIVSAVGKAVRKARCPNAAGGVTQKDVVLAHLDDAIADVSGNGQYRFNQRQLLYRLRPIVMTELKQKLETKNFGQIISKYEEENGEIPLMYREPRGSITHPHSSGGTITLGTLMVEQYKRPTWAFNKLVYIEKEGANEALKDDGWLERHDCAVMSSKGYSTRAARDLIDKLAEHDEPIEVFCVHDADASGTMIYQTLQEATVARGARNIAIKNIGLEPWEAIDMGLEVEEVEVTINKKTKEPIRKPVAEYVKYEDSTAPDGEDWDEWLQTRRVEMNAMTTPQFIEWLDDKMADEAEHGKLIPPPEVLEADLAERIEKKTRTAIIDRVLREAKVDKLVKAAVATIKKPSAVALTKGIKALFKAEPDAEWRAHIETVADDKTKV